MSIDFDPVKVGARPRRIDPVQAVVLAIVVGLGLAIVKPWSSTAVPDGPRASAAVTSPTKAASDPATSVPSARPTRTAAPADVTGLPLPTWAEVSRVVEPHDVWGVRAILLARRPSVGLPASPRFLERWSRTTPNASSIEIARVVRGDETVVALGITVPPDVKPIDMRIWRLHANDDDEWIDARRLDPSDRAGVTTFVRPRSDGSVDAWAAGHYRVDLLAADQLYSIGVLVPDPSGSVPSPDEWPASIETNLVPPDQSDPSSVRAGPFATVDGGGLPLAAQPRALMSAEEAWRNAVAETGAIGRPVVATAYLPRATALGVMLTNHASIHSAIISRLVPNGRFVAGSPVGGISNTYGGTPWIAFPAPGAGPWPAGVYAITVDWLDSAGEQVQTWHIELRPGLRDSGQAR